MLRPDVRAAPPYHFSARPQAIKLDQNESPYDLPENLKKEVAARLAAIPFHRYPEINAQTLRAKLAQRHDWPPAGVVVSGGSNILIQALVTAAGLGQSVLSVKPTFSVYALQARLQGAQLIERALGEDFSLPLDDLKLELARSQGVFFLANPAAPTGNIFSTDSLEALAKASAEKWLFVIDEAYHQFSSTDALPLVRNHPHVVSLRTFSKAFGLGGVRLGYALMQPSLAEQVQKVIMPFSVSALQLAVGEVVLDAPDYVQDRVREALTERERVFRALSGLSGVTPYPSRTNFILFRVPDAGALYEGLLGYGVVVRRQDHVPGLANCLRVSVGTPPENDAFLAAMSDLVAPPLEVSRG